ncbi:MAG: MurR/RpiR family transcriptional regulator [Clostridia bacterium]|nr:MurR/RpiR family transcriptional regulator [Clostridia bacterium]
MAINILTEVKTSYTFLSKVETRIADLLLRDPQAFIGLTITELSERAAVSQGSINNFSRKLCGGGFAKLKLEIAACLPLTNDVPFTAVDPAQSIKTAMEVKSRDIVSAFRNTLELNDESTLQRVVNLIARAKKIEICGVLTSGSIAQSLCIQLISLGISASYISEPLISAVSASMLGNEGLIIAISSSGRTKEVLEIVELAKQSGVPVVCLTANKYSPLAELSDEVLLASAGHQTVSDRMSEIRASQFLLIDTLCAYLRSTVDTSGREQYYRLQQILDSHSVTD